LTNLSRRLSISHDLSDCVDFSRGPSSNTEPRTPAGFSHCTSPVIELAQYVLPVPKESQGRHALDLSILERRNRTFRRPAIAGGLITSTFWPAPASLSTPAPPLPLCVLRHEYSIAARRHASAIPTTGCGRARGHARPDRSPASRPAYTPAAEIFLQTARVKRLFADIFVG